jgi:hypothetical protein
MRPEGELEGKPEDHFVDVPDDWRQRTRQRDLSGIGTEPDGDRKRGPHSGQQEKGTKAGRKDTQSFVGTIAEYVSHQLPIV